MKIVEFVWIGEMKKVQQVRTHKREMSLYRLGTPGGAIIIRFDMSCAQAHWVRSKPILRVMQLKLHKPIMAIGYSLRMCARHVDSTNPGRSNLVFRSKPILEAKMSNRVIQILCLLSTIITTFDHSSISHKAISLRSDHDRYCHLVPTTTRLRPLKMALQAGSATRIKIEIYVYLTACLSV